MNEELNKKFNEAEELFFEEKYYDALFLYKILANQGHEAAKVKLLHFIK
jgi:hypothetical protein